MEALIAILPGDGIGPEVTQEGVRVLNAIAEQHGHRFELRVLQGDQIRRDIRGFPVSQPKIRHERLIPVVVGIL